MSSISGKKNEDEVRRTREEYQSRDSKKTKKHSQEVKSMNEAHQAEIDALKKEHEAQLVNLKEKTQEALTRRDMEFQREISEMRKLHSEQLKRSAAETEQRSNEIEKALRSELAQTQSTSETQKKNLSDNFTEQMQIRDENMQQWADRSRESQQDAITGQKARMSKAHKEETDALIEERNRRQEAAQLAYNQLRKGKDTTIANQKRNYENQMDRLSNSYESAARNHAEDDRVRDEITRDSFQAGLAENRERYRKAIDREKQATENARGAMADVVENRLGKKVMVLEEEKHNLEVGRQRDQTRLGAKHQNEMNNLRNAFSRNIEDYERQKREMLNASNEKTSQEMTKLTNKNNSHLYEQNKFYQEKISMDKIRNDDRFAQAEEDHATKAQIANTSNESRVQKLKNFGDLEKEKLRKYFEEASGTMRENFDTTLREMRARNQDEKNKLFAHFNSESRESEQRFTEKMNEVALQYEKQLAALDEKHNKELKAQSYQYERIIAEKDKKSRAEFDTQTSQLSHRLTKNDEQHKRELDDLKRKHQETLANLLKTRQS